MKRIIVIAAIVAAIAGAGAVSAEDATVEDLYAMGEKYGTQIAKEHNVYKPGIAETECKGYACMGGLCVEGAEMYANIFKDGCVNGYKKAFGK